MRSISHCVLLVVLHSVRGNRPGFADVHQTSTQDARLLSGPGLGPGGVLESSHASLIDEGRTSVDHASQESLSLSVGVNNLQHVSPHDSWSPSIDATAPDSRLKPPSELMEMRLLKEGIIEVPDEEDELEDNAEESPIQEGAGSTPESLLQSSLNRKTFGSLDRRKVPNAVGTKVIAARAIKLPKGLVPVGSTGEIKQGRELNYVHWKMPGNLGSSWNYIYANTEICADGQVPLVGQVTKSQMILRATAQKELDYRDSGDSLAERGPSDKAPHQKCKHWMVQCAMEQFGNNTMEQKITNYQRRVNIVRHKAKDSVGGCDYSFECINAIPFRIDAKTSEFIRAGVRCSSWHVGVTTEFWQCFVGKDRVRLQFWDNVCRVCGYTSYCVGCNIARGRNTPNPYSNMHQGWKRSDVFDRDVR